MQVPPAFQQILNMDPARVVGIAFSTLGTAFLLVIALLYWNDRKATTSSERVTGTVVNLDYNSSRSAVPVIEYRYHGKKKILIGSVWSSPPAFDVDDKVDLLVNYEDPTNVTIDRFIERYFLISLFALFAVVFGGIGYGLLIFLKK